MTDPDTDRRRARIVHLIARLERTAINDEILLSTLQHAISNIIGRIRVNRDDINKEIQALRDLITEDNKRDQDAVDQLNSTISDLRAQITATQDNGGTVEADDLDNIFAQLEGLKGMIQPVDAASGSMNRTTVDASGNPPVAGTTAGGTPINPPDTSAEPTENTDTTTDTGSGTIGNSGA